MWGDVQRAAESFCNWWQLAGHDVAMADHPHDWLGKAAPEKAATEAGSPVQSTVGDHSRRARENLAVPASAKRTSNDAAPDGGRALPTASDGPLPADLESFQRWWIHDAAVPGAQWGPRRIAPVGPRDAPLMIACACPEPGDLDDEQLFAGRAGSLLDAMLATIGLTRASCYLASLAPTRPPSGRVPSEDLPALARIFWHHVALAAPQRLMLIGNSMAQLACGQDVASAQGRLLEINQHGVTMEAIAILHPRMLLDRPALKASAWASLKQFRVDIATKDTAPC